MTPSTSLAPSTVAPTPFDTALIGVGDRDRNAKTMLAILIATSALIGTFLVVVAAVLGRRLFCPPSTPVPSTDALEIVNEVFWIEEV